MNDVVRYVVDHQVEVEAAVASERASVESDEAMLKEALRAAYRQHESFAKADDFASDQLKKYQALQAHLQASAAGSERTDGQESARKAQPSRYGPSATHLGRRPWGHGTAETNVSFASPQERLEIASEVVAHAYARVRHESETIKAQSGQPSNEHIMETRARLALSEQALQAALDEAILPLAREYINEQLENDKSRLYKLTFETVETSGLREFVAARHEVATRAFSTFEDAIARVAGGSIGIAGPRGCGKSTLMNSHCKAVQDSGGIAIVVTAPVKYVPQEFLIHIGNRLSQEVLARYSGGSSTQATRRRELLQTLRRWMTGVGVALLVAGLVQLAAAATSSLRLGDAIAIAAAVIATALAMFGRVLRLYVILAAGAIVCLIGAMTSGSAGLVSIFAGWPDVRFLSTLVLALALITLLANRWLGTVVTAVVAQGLLVLDVVANNGPDNAIAVGCVLLVGAIVLTGGARAITRPTIEQLRLSAEADSVLETTKLQILNRLGSDFAALLAAIGASFVGAGLIFPDVVVDTTLLWALACLVVGAEAISFKWPVVAGRHRGESAVDHEEFDSSLTTSAHDLVATLNYTRTESREQRYGLRVGPLSSIPISLEQAVGERKSYTHGPAAFPEAVSKYQGLVKALAQKSAVVIGIDELDKLDYASAERFVNDAKAIFDVAVARCHYVVSVSEDALASFEQRGLPLRGVFDSAFDEIIAVEPLEFDDAWAVMRRRIVDLPVGFVALCYAVSGGIARDLIRAARDMVDLRLSSDCNGLADLTRLLVARQQRTRLDGLRRTASQLDAPGDVERLLAWVSSLPTDHMHSSASASFGSYNSAEVANLARLHACSYYQLATIEEYFCTASQADFEEAAALAAGKSSFDELARGRQLAANSWSLAWESISRFRSSWDMGVVSVSVHVD